MFQKEQIQHHTVQYSVLFLTSELSLRSVGSDSFLILCCQHQASSSDENVSVILWIVQSGPPTREINGKQMSLLCSDPWPLLNKTFMLQNNRASPAVHQHYQSVLNNTITSLTAYSYQPCKLSLPISLREVENQLVLVMSFHGRIRACQMPQGADYQLGSVCQFAIRKH